MSGQVTPCIDPERFCYYPFMQLLLQPTGVVSPCCWNQEVVLGQLPQQSLAQIWNGDALRRLRHEFLEGNPVTCAQQLSHIKCHLSSRRPYQGQISLQERQESGPARLDIRLNGSCNLKCVMCDVWQQPSGVYDRSDFWDKGRTELFPYLREVDVLGGEPFIQRDTYRLVEAVSAASPKCCFAFVTNGQFRFAGKIQGMLDKIDIRWIMLSLDSINPETYRSIRVNGELERALETLKRLQLYRFDRERQKRGFDLLISMCVQKANCREVGEVIEFTRKCGVTIVLQYAYQPAAVSLATLSRQEKTEVSQYFESLVPSFGRECLDPVLLPLMESIHER